MKLISAATALAAALLAGPVLANAQDASVEGSGYQLTERTVAHPSFSAETGLVSNVFYTESSPVSAGLLRLLGGIDLSPIDDTQSKGGTPPDFTFTAGVRFAYEEYLSPILNVQRQRNLGLGADIALKIKPSGELPISFEDNFTRLSRPTNFESDQLLTRDFNSVRANASYVPKNRNISARVQASNYIEVFESQRSSFANRLQTDFQLGIDWQFLPITKFFLEGSYGLYSGLGTSSTKASSTPMRATLGIATAITESITTKGSVGYALSSYSGGPGFSNITYHLEGGLRYSPVGRLQLIFDRNFEDSINSNFYGEYSLRLRVDQQISRVMLVASAGGRLRNYQGGLVAQIGSGGAASRDDVILDALVEATYEVNEWLTAHASYDGSTVQTTYKSVVDGAADDPSYVRHQVMVGANASF